MANASRVALASILLVLATFTGPLPANATIPQALARGGSITLRPTEGAPSTAAIDSSAGLAYFGIDGGGTLTGGILVKVRLSDYTRVGTIILNPGEDAVSTSLIDPSADFGYFGIITNGQTLLPGIIIRVRLSDFTRNATLTLRQGLSQLATGIIDPGAGFAYFGTNTAPAVVVKIRLADFTLNATLVLGNEVNLTTSIIDPTGGFAYFGTYTNPADIVRVRLSDFTLNATRTLLPGEFFLKSSAIDLSRGFAYFGTSDTPFPGTIVKVKLSDFSENESLTMNAGENVVNSAAIDPVGGFGYFGTDCWNCANPPGDIVKVRFSDFTRAGILPLGLGVASSTANIDSAGFGYFGTQNSTASTPGVVLKVRLSDLTPVDALLLYVGDNYLESSVIDSTAGFAYYGSATGTIVKVRLSDFARVGSLVVSLKENQLASAVIAPVGGFAYFGTDCFNLCSLPGTIVKVRLSDFTINATLTLNADENGLSAAVIDSANGFGYFGTYTGILVKIRLSDFTRVGALDLRPSSLGISTSVIDPIGGFVYLGSETETNPGSNQYAGSIVKIRLSDFTEVGSIVPDVAYENHMTTSVIDPAAGYAYFGTDCIGYYCYASSYPIVKVRLSDFKIVATLDLGLSIPYGGNHATSSVIDPTAGYAYFSLYTTPSSITKVRLSDFTVYDNLNLTQADQNMLTSVIDPAAGFAYFGTGTYPGIVVKVQIDTPPPPTFDFSLSSSGSITIQQGSASTETIISTLTGSTSQEVYLSCAASSLPAEASCSFSPAFLTPSATGTNSLLTINTTASTPLGSFLVQVTARPLGATTQSTSFSLTVTSPPPDVGLGATPTSVNLQAGSRGTSTISLTPLHGFSGTLSLSVNAPSALTCSLDQASVQISAIASSVILTCSGNTLGNYPVTITATSGTLERQTTVTVIVTRPPGLPTPTNAPTILGLDSTLFYIIAGSTVALVAIVSIGFSLRSRKP